MQLNYYIVFKNKNNIFLVFLKVYLFLIEG